MDADRKRTRQQIGDIPTKAEYLALMDGVKLTALERKICDMRYLDGQNMGFIADFLGFAEVTIKKHHAKALKKTSKSHRRMKWKSFTKTLSGSSGRN